MRSILLKSASVFAFCVFAVPAFAQSMSAGVDPYGYGNVPLPPPQPSYAPSYMPSYQAQQSASGNYAQRYATSTVAQTAMQPAARAPYGLLTNTLPVTQAVVSSPVTASSVGYSVQASAPNAQLPAPTQYAQQYGQQYGQQQAVQYAAPAYATAQDMNAGANTAYASAQQYAPQQQMQQVQQAAPSYAPSYQTSGSITAAPTYDTSSQMQMASNAPTYNTQQYAQPSYQQQVVQQQQPQVQTYSYAPQNSGQTYTTSQPLTVTEQTSAQPTDTSPRDVSLATDPSTSPWYMTLRSGITIPSDTSFKIKGANVENEYQTGWQLGTGVGYEFRAWNKWLAPRAELELVYDQQLVDAHNINGAKTSDPDAYGFVRSLDLMANGFLDFRLNRILSPYIGGGVGAGYSDFDRFGTSATGVVLDDNDVGFVWQAMGGLGISLNNSSTIDLGYRYKQNTGLTLKARDGTTSTTDESKHVFMIGFRNNF